MKHCSLFSGIGGFDLAAEWMGWQNIFQVEIDNYCRKVLHKNFPNTKKYEDIKQFNGTEYRGKIDILTGGFPCQPFSGAGKRKGKKDDRYLWPQMLRVIKEIKPTWIIAENVYGLLNINRGLVFKQVLADLERENYQTQAFIIPACGLNAPHRRYRVWIVANTGREHGEGQPDKEKFIRKITEGHAFEFERSTEGHGIETDTNPNSSGYIYREFEKHTAETREHAQREFKQCNSDVANTTSGRFKKFGINGKSEENNFIKIHRWGWEKNWYEVAAQFCRVDDGVSNRVDRLKGLGNAIVPGIAYELFKSIEAAELNNTHAMCHISE